MTGATTILKPTAAVVQLRARPGALWDNLLSLPVPDEIKQAFERARTEPNNPFALPTEIVFPTNEYPIQCWMGNDKSLLIEDPELLQIARETFSGEWTELPPSEPAHELALALREAGLFALPPTPLVCDRPGIYRLQHASLLFRSEAGTGIITDPVSGLTPIDWIMPACIPHVDAVLVSHSHSDHFSLLTLLQFPRATIMIVPNVGRPSMLCPDMAGMLRDAGFTNVIAAPWYSTVRVKDIDVHVYPFYGEQPWLSFAAPVTDLRNHRNTYAVAMDRFTSWFLIDSGTEFEHSMDEVCEIVLRDLGKIDIVFSNLRSFRWHPKQIDSSGRYLFCFPANALDHPATWPRGQAMTFEPSGMRRFLATLKPDYFLPYAHWWHPPGETAHIVDGVTPEAEMLRAVRDAATNTTTELLRWQVGNRVELKYSRLSIHSALL